MVWRSGLRESKRSSLGERVFPNLLISSTSRLVNRLMKFVSVSNGASSGRLLQWSSDELQIFSCFMTNRNELLSALKFRSLLRMSEFGAHRSPEWRQALGLRCIRLAITSFFTFRPSTICFQRLHTSSQRSKFSTSSWPKIMHCSSIGSLLIALSSLSCDFSWLISSLSLLADPSSSSIFFRFTRISSCSSSADLHFELIPTVEGLTLPKSPGSKSNLLISNYRNGSPKWFTLVS